jgi:hypothetical protein
MATLNEILLDSASYLDLDATLPTGTELITRIRFGNMAVDEWANAAKWRQLKTETTPSLASFASIGLSNFQYLDGAPMEYLSEGVYQAYPEIAPSDRFSKPVSSHYSYVTGNNSSGIALHVNGISVNSTLTIPYIRGASTMATLTDICEVPDCSFITQRIISYVLQARNDERFPTVMAEGNRILRNMITSDQIRLPGGNNSVPKKGVAAYSIGV